MLHAGCKSDFKETYAERPDSKARTHSDVALSAKKHTNYIVKLLASCMTNFTFMRNQKVSTIDYLLCILRIVSSLVSYYIAA